MLKTPFAPILSASLALILISLACGSAAPTPTPTSTPVPATATATKKPTPTPRPTATPNFAATQEYKDFYSQVKGYYDKGQLASTNGTYKALDDFSESWPQIDWYQYWPAHDAISDFLFSAHFRWSAASQTPDVSGCGLVFAYQQNGDHYAVFLDRSRVLVVHADVSKDNRSYEVGKTRGTGRVSFGNPAEADFALAVNSYHAFVYVNKELIGEYTLSVDSVMKGELYYTLLSGTNKDYGTRCEMTHVRLWIIQ